MFLSSQDALAITPKITKLVSNAHAHFCLCASQCISYLLHLKKANAVQLTGHCMIQFVANDGTYIVIYCNAYKLSDRMGY